MLLLVDCTGHLSHPDGYLFEFSIGEVDRGDNKPGPAKFNPDILERFDAFLDSEEIAGKISHHGAITSITSYIDSYLIRVGSCSVSVSLSLSRPYQVGFGTLGLGCEEIAR